MPRRLVPSLALLLTVAGLLLSGPAATAGPGYHEPHVGDCHAYGARAINASTESRDPVSCDAAHTALTVAVVRAPGRVDLADEEQAFRAVGAQCYRGMFAALGGDQATRDLSAYSLAYFLPTSVERQHGARWVRCDLYLSGGTTIATLPTPLLGSLPLDDSTARCLQVDHATQFVVTVCSQTHNYRAEGIVPLRGRFRSDAAFAKIAEQRCPDLAGDHYFYNSPNEQAWQAGDKRITCSRRTHS